MEQIEIAKLRRDLALALAGGKINDTLCQLKKMPIQTLEALNNAETRNIVERNGADEKELEVGLVKLNFYVCGILMHRILDGE